MAAETYNHELTVVEKTDVTERSQHIEGSSSSGDVENNATDNKLELHRTLSQVPGNPNYFQSEGLRTQGDGQDHSTYNPTKLSFIMTVIGIAVTICAAQMIPLFYLTLSTRIALDLNASGNTLWLLTIGNTLGGAVAPAVGPMSDFLSRKVLLLGSITVCIVGAILCAAAPNASGYLAGQALLGVGLIAEELIAGSIISEIVPTAKRPFYYAITLTVTLPWSASTSYANWLTAYSWRWIGCILALWHCIALVLLAFFYRPPPRINSKGLSVREIIKRIDFIGMLLLIAGIILLLTAINWGDQVYPWASGRVLGLFFAGVALLVLFGLWEAFLVKYPLYPRRIIHAKRPFFCLLFVIFSSSINYIPCVVLWPLESIAVFQTDDNETAINTLPIGLCIIGGAIISTVLLGFFKKRSALIITIFCVVQTIAVACMVLVDPNDIRTAWPQIVFTLLCVGGVLLPNQILITVITPDDLLASITALTYSLRALSQVTGIAIFYTRFNSGLIVHAANLIAPAFVQIGVYDAELITTAISSLAAMPLRNLIPLVPQLAVPENFEVVLQASKTAFLESFKEPYYIAIAFGVPACIAAAFIGNLEKYFDQHVAVVL